MSIYQSAKVLPYVYMCTEKETGAVYIGYRYANKVPSTQDFGTYYFTSNQYVKNNFSQFDYIIVAEFFNKRDALEFESALIKEHTSLINVVKNPPFKGTTYRPKTTYTPEDQVCALPGCNKVFRNYRSKCCCIGHSRKYAALKRHIKV